MNEVLQGLVPVLHLQWFPGGHDARLRNVECEVGAGLTLISSGSLPTGSLIIEWEMRWSGWVRKN